MKTNFNFYTIYFFVFLFAFSCTKENNFALKNNANESFYLQVDKANMPVKVQGNTLSKVFVLVIHGGPGGEALSTYNGSITDTLKSLYGMVYWDQRSAGNTQGGKGEKLTVDVYVQDLEKLILLLKNKYGNDIQFFLYGHSWGGMLTSSYLIKSNNQQNITGWIDIDGVHNYPLNDVFTRNMIDSIGTIEMANGRNVEEWKKMVEFCRELTLPTDLIKSSKLNGYAFKAEILMADSIGGESGTSFGDNSMLNYSSMLSHDKFMGVGNTALYEELMTKNNSPFLSKITIPSLFCWGRYDFVVPPGMMLDAYFKVSSINKRAITFTYSGHSPMYNQTTVFNRVVVDFIEGAR